MMKKIFLLPIFAILMSFVCLMPQTRIFSLGDSTMADYDTLKYSGENEQRGWGQMLPQFLGSTAVLKNAARNGRSSKSFYYEVWKNLRTEVKAGDLVFIQFGHNDEKADGLDTDIKDTTARGTAPWGQYQFFLRKYITETRERGAIPVLFTSVVRLDLKEGKTSLKGLHNLGTSPADTTLDYPYTMRRIAKEMNVPLIDMTLLTQALVESYGQEKAKKMLYVTKDNTHLKAEGAKQFARLAYEELLKRGILKK